MLGKICVGNRHIQSEFPWHYTSMYELITPSFWHQNRNALIKALGPITDSHVMRELWVEGQKRKGGPSSLLKPSASLSPWTPYPVHVPSICHALWLVPLPRTPRTGCHEGPQSLPMAGTQPRTHPPAMQSHVWPLSCDALWLWFIKRVCYYWLWSYRCRGLKEERRREAHAGLEGKLHFFFYARLCPSESLSGIFPSSLSLYDSLTVCPAVPGGFDATNSTQIPGMIAEMHSKKLLNNLVHFYLFDRLVSFLTLSLPKLKPQIKYSLIMIHHVLEQNNFPSSFIWLFQLGNPNDSEMIPLC
jgi:hypothetical protein